MVIQVLDKKFQPYIKAEQIQEKVNGLAAKINAEYAGKNPLFIYLLSEIGLIILWSIPIGEQDAFSWIYTNIFKHAGPYIGSLLFALWWMLTCWAVGWWMDRKKVYVRV